MACQRSSSGTPPPPQPPRNGKRKVRNCYRACPTCPEGRKRQVRPEEAGTAEGLHYVQVRPQQPGNVLHAHMHDLGATGYNERKAVGRAEQIQPINLHGLQPINFQGFVPPMVDNNTAAALLYGTVPPRSDTNTASHTWSVEEAAAAQQALNHSAHAPYPAPILYNVGPYWQGNRAVSRTFSHKRPKGSRAAATLNTFASTPDPAAVPGGTGPRRDAEAVTGHIVPTEGPAIIFPKRSTFSKTIFPI
jgi:hypothetical protein